MQMVLYSLLSDTPSARSHLSDTATDQDARTCSALPPHAGPTEEGVHSSDAGNSTYICITCRVGSRRAGWYIRFCLLHRAFCHTLSAAATRLLLPHDSAALRSLFTSPLPSPPGSSERTPSPLAHHYPPASPPAAVGFTVVHSLQPVHSFNLAGSAPDSSLAFPSHSRILACSHSPTSILHRLCAPSTFAASRLGVALLYILC